MHRSQLIGNISYFVQQNITFHLERWRVKFKFGSDAFFFSMVNNFVSKKKNHGFYYGKFTDFALFINNYNYKALCD